MGQGKQFRVILFDLGGVLLRLNDPIEIFELQIDKAEFADRWLRSPAVREFERGAIDTESFAKRVVKEAELPYDWQGFLQRFDAWPDRLFDETIDVLNAIPDQINRALLSNINAQHWGRDEIAGQIADHLDQAFLSYKTGLVKPDREAFEMVTNTYACQPAEVLFFDDSLLNVSAAADFGMQAVHAVGIAEVSSTLHEHGVLKRTKS
jgi:putative hydrolase of the HAD superfamily